jgi:hypothetical protein
MPAMKRSLLILIILFSSIFILQSQDQERIVRALVIDGDTIPQISLMEIEVYSIVVPKNRRKQRKLSRYIKNVKKVYPYAKLAGIQLRKYEYQLLNASNNKERRQLMKQAEKEINEKYGGELRDLTFSQGKILIKLIDRETGDSSFELVQQLRGKFTAFWYQAFAKIWGYNLKLKYDPNGEDRQLEAIVKMIERGQI